MIRNVFAICIAIAFVGCAPTKSADSHVMLGTEGVSPRTISRALLEGGPNPPPATVEVSNGGNCPVALTTRRITIDGGTWFDITPGTGTVDPQSDLTLTITFDISGLRPGTHTGSAIFEGTCTTNGRPAIGSPKTVSINLVIEPRQGSLQVDQTDITIDVPTLSQTWTSLLVDGVPRQGHVAVWTGYEMIVHGGQTPMGLTNSGFRYEPISGQSRPLSTTLGVGGGTAMILPRSRAAAAWNGAELIVVGGDSPSGPTTACLRLTGDRWLPCPSLPQGELFDAPGLWTSLGMLAVVTGDPAGVRVHRLGIGATQWTTSSAGPALGAGSAFVWTGDRLVFFGIAGGASYDPATDTWSSISSAGAPAGRTGHSMVWTGREVAVFGGTAAGTVLDDGGLYDPAADRWRPIPPPTTGAYHNHAAVWTGDRMVIYGGRRNATQPAPNTSVFNPARGVWTGFPSAFLDGAREDSTAIWTGREVIVYGGRTVDAPPALLGNGGTLAALPPMGAVGN